MVARERFFISEAAQSTLSTWLDQVAGRAVDPVYLDAIAATQAWVAGLDPAVWETVDLSEATLLKLKFWVMVERQRGRNLQPTYRALLDALADWLGEALGRASMAVEQGRLGGVLAADLLGGVTSPEVLLEAALRAWETYARSAPEDARIALSEAAIADWLDGVTPETPSLDRARLALLAHLRRPRPVPVPSTAPRAPSLIGYSNVCTIDAVEAEIVLAAGGRLVQVEACPFDSEADGGIGVASFSIERLARIAEVVRRYPDSILLLTVCNWNGASQRAQDDAWFRARVEEIRDRIGTAQVWLEGVSEPDAFGKAVTWQQIAADVWESAGGTLVGNGPGGRGTPAVGSKVDWHYCDYGLLLEGVRSGGARIHSLDCTPVLASNLSEAQIREVVRAALAAKATLILYDTSNAPAANASVIRWMTEEIKAAAPGQPPAPPGDAPPLASPDLLAQDELPWRQGDPGVEVSPRFEARLRALLQAHPDAVLTIANLAEIPRVMGEAGWEGRDTAKWYCLSRSFEPPWPWAVNPSDGDSVYFDGLRDETSRFWANYLDVIIAAMLDFPRCEAIVVSNDAVDRCGNTLQEKTVSYLTSVLRNRLHLGEVVED